MERSKCPNGSDTLLSWEYLLLHSVKFISHVDVLPSFDEAGLMSCKERKTNITKVKDAMRNLRATRCFISEKYQVSDRRRLEQEEGWEAMSGKHDVFCCALL